MTKPSHKTVKGRTQTKKSKVKKNTSETVFSANVSPVVKKGSGRSKACSLSSTPKRGRKRKQLEQEACLTSTPIHNSSASDNSKSRQRTKRVEQQRTEAITQSKTSGVRSSCNASKSQSRKCHIARTTQVGKRVPTVQKQACNGSSASPVECRRGRKKKSEKTNSDMDTATQPSKRCRPRFELEVSHTTEQDESAVSSDLSIELSHHEQLMGCLSFKEEEEDEDEEELPSFLMQEDRKPSITKGQFVWCKYRSYPLWPALVKSVNCKMKKASIKFIDNFLVEQKNGLTVALKTLKPFDCEDANDLMLKAKEKYDTAIEWSTELINDYRMRIACRSFSGSFFEYFVHDISYPVRRKYPQVVSERFGIISDVVSCDDSKDDSFCEHQEEEVSRTSKRLLPDRTCAAHNRANEKLVHFIVKQRMVDQHLLAVICGQQQSRWLRAFLNTNRRRVVSVYLEDDRQVDEVYMYLSDFYSTAVDTARCLAEVKSTERVSFVLDVLFPEAIICAIAGVDDISFKKAEEKYRKGRCISNRERQEFDLMIEQHMRTKLQYQDVGYPSLMCTLSSSG